EVVVGGKTPPAKPGAARRPRRARAPGGWGGPPAAGRPPAGGRARAPPLGRAGRRARGAPPARGAAAGPGGRRPRAPGRRAPRARGRAVTAAGARARPGITLAALAGELRGEQNRLTALDAGDPATSVRAAFSWSYQQLTGPAARMFRLLGLAPGTGITTPA